MFLSCFNGQPFSLNILLLNENKIDFFKILFSSLQLGSEELVSAEDLEYETEHEHRKRHWSAKDLVSYLKTFSQ